MQEALFLWAKLKRIPELDLMFAIPNGGYRDWKTAKFLKAEGVKAGVPDIFLPVARQGSHGLFIELKYGRNRQTPQQLAFSQRLSEQGYTVVVCYSVEEACRIIESYLHKR